MRPSPTVTAKRRAITQARAASRRSWRCSRVTAEAAGPPSGRPPPLDPGVFPHLGAVVALRGALVQRPGRGVASLGPLGLLDLDEALQTASLGTRATVSSRPAHGFLLGSSARQSGTPQGCSRIAGVATPNSAGAAGGPYSASRPTAQRAASATAGSASPRCAA